jgi:hypothetical protein
MIHLIDLDGIAYYNESGSRSGLGLEIVAACICRLSYRAYLSSFGVNDWCKLHTLGVF